MSIHHLKDGRWCVNYRDRESGKTKRRYFGRGLEAHAKAREFNDSLSLHSYQRTEIYSPTFAEVAIAYMKAKSGSMPAASRYALSKKLMSVILPEIGEEPAAQIKAEALDAYQRKRRRGGYATDSGKTRRAVKFTTVHREISDIQAILNWAAKPSRRLIEVNPLAGYEKPRRDDATIIPARVEELRAIIAHAAPHLVRALYISYYTGLRPGVSEMYGLTWDHVDFAAGTILVISARKGGLRERYIPLHEAFTAHLRKWHAEDMAAGQRLLISFKGKPVTSLKTSFTAAKRRAGVTRRFPMYATRHAFATLILKQRGDLKSVSELLSHTRTETTTRQYQTTDTEMHRQAVNMLPAIDFTPPTPGLQKSRSEKPRLRLIKS